MSIRIPGIPKFPAALVVAVASLFLTAPVASAGFSAPAKFEVGTGPEMVATGDLNGDGNLDMVVPNTSLGNVSVLLGNGDGSFGAKVNFGVAQVPTSVAIADIDDDSFPDLAVSNSGSDNVSVLLGDGTGTFSAPTNIAVGDYPVVIAAGLLNADEIPDFVVANQNSGDLTVLINDGEGAFVNTTISTGSSARSVAIGDLDNDGKNDLAVASAGAGKATTLLGNGDGSFQPPVNFNVSLNPFSVAIGDLNGDDYSDLAVVNNLANSVAVLLNDGAGSFGAATFYTTGSAPRAVAIGNLVGDDNLDLVVANSSSNPVSGNTVSVYEGDGDGGFAPKVDYPAGSQPFGVTVADFDSDQNPDLAVASSGEAKASVLLNQAPTATSSPAALAFPSQGLNTTSGTLPVTVLNSSGGDPLSVDGYSIEGVNATDFEVDDQTCDTDPVPFDGTCLMQVSFTPPALGARSATLKVTYNGAGSPLTLPLTGTGTDITPPDTVIDSGPSGTITTGSATFSFHGDPVGDTSKIMCKLDSAAFADCTSPKIFSGLADGSHTVTFRAQDSAGNQDPTPATRTFTVVTPVPPPVRMAKIGKVTVKGPAKARKGKKATYTVKVTNSGNAAASGVKLRVSGKGVSLKKTIGQVASGKTRSLKVKLRFRKPGKVKATFKVTSSNAGTKTTRKKVRTRK